MCLLFVRSKFQPLYIHQPDKLLAPPAPTDMRSERRRPWKLMLEQDIPHKLHTDPSIKEDNEFSSQGYFCHWRITG